MSGLFPAGGHDPRSPEVITADRLRPVAFLRLHSSWWVFAAILAISFITFLPSLRVLVTPEFFSHYEEVLCEGRPIRLSLLRQEIGQFGKPRPLASLLHLGLLATCKDQPVIYKAVHVVLFSLAGVALYHVVCGWAGRSTAFLTAVSFLLFPPPFSAESLVHVMSLERHVSMGLLLFSYLAWRRGNTQGEWGWIALSTCLLVLALLSKESVLLLPLAFPFLYIFVERSSGPSLRRSLRRVVPLLAVVLLWMLVRLLLKNVLRYGFDEGGPAVLHSLLWTNLMEYGRLILGVKGRTDSVWFSSAAWAVILLLQLSHRRWTTRAAGILWMILALSPHVFLRYAGGNHAYYVLPWICYSAVRGIDTIAGTKVSSSLFRGFLWAVILGFLAGSQHLATRRAAAPWAALADVRQWVLAQPFNDKTVVRIKLAETPYEVGGHKVGRMIQCGTILRRDQVRVRPRGEAAIPKRAVSGEALGLRWWAWLTVEQ